MRIAIVNDLKLAIEVLRRTVAMIPGATIAWIAEDGKQAVEKCAGSAGHHSDGHADAGDERRRGDAADHGEDAVPDPGGDGDGGRELEQGV